MRRRNLPSAMVFLDLSEAFHRVARPLVHGGDLCPEHVSSIVAALGLHPDVVPRLQTYVTQQSLLIKAGASTWTGQVLQEFSQDSWFVHGSLEGTAIVRSGTRPGDNLADMVFSFLFAEILHSLRRQFRQAGLRLSLPWREDWLCAPPLEVSEAASQNSVSPLDITWMDDLALLVTAERACDLPAKVAAVATTTITECVQATLLPNLAQGKTEAVLSLRGPGSQAVRADLFRGSEPSIELHSDIWPAARLRVVPKYRHVGGILEAGGGLKKELKSRIGSAWSAFRQHKRQVFMSPVVTHREKAVLFASLIESTLYYGVGTWPNIEAPVVAKFQGALVGMARLMLRPTYSIEAARHLSADLCLAIARILPAANAMRIERLRHFATTVRNANAELWALLHYERGWLQHVQTDITWMGQQLELAGHSSSEVSTWERAIETIRGRPRRWKHLVRLSRDTALLQAHWAAEKQQFYGLLCRQLARLALQTGRDNLPWKSVEFARRSSLTCVPGRTMPLRYTKGFARNDFLSVANNARFVFDILPTPRSCAITCVTHLRASQLSCWKVVLVSHSPVLAADDLTMARRLNCLRYRRKDPSARGGQGKLSRRNRPDETTLLALEDLFCQEDSLYWDLEELLRSYRKAFQKTCLQASRLQATAKAWHRALANQLCHDEEIGVQWAAWHALISDRLLEVDWVVWLAPDSTFSSPATSTFRDALLVLPWFTFELVHVPSLTWPGEPVLCLGVEHAAATQSLSHETVISSPELLDFAYWAEERSSPGPALLSCVGLITSLDIPGPVKSFSILEEALRRLRLYSDASRP
eukprot:s5632_g3.t1